MNVFDRIVNIELKLIFQLSEISESDILAIVYDKTIRGVKIHYMFIFFLAKIS